ncbi:MAG: RDD family protein [Gammaproteobacteria bacterium]|nr:RDD family protein [Gammaproteobacteria bacterium]
MPLADKNPGLLRRLGAMLYDALLLLALLMLATALLMPISRGAIQIDNIAYQLYLLSIVTGYFVYFWLRHGQTLGMRTWKIRLVRADGQALTLGDTLRRLVFSVLSWLPLGLGFWRILFNRQRLAWHDRWSGTLLVMVMSRQRKAPTNEPG